MTDDGQSGSAPTPGSADLAPGTTLSNTYEIIEYLALGGMAEVYRARNIHTDEPVAIKVVLPEFARDETRLALFRKEATVLSRLHHEAIVHYHMFTVEKETNRPYLVMEFVKGTPLSERMKEGPLDAQSVKTLIQRVATGLSAAHELGVVHRDLSPDNVVLSDGRMDKAKIIDFGIAKDSGGGTLLGGKFAGKYNFVSPEQLGLFGGEITGQSDIYSLGLIAVAALRGEALDMSGTHAEVIDKRRAVPDLSGVDESIRPAIEAMLTPDPALRPKTMQEVVDILVRPVATAKAMPGAAEDPWSDPTPAKPAAAPAPWEQPAGGATVIAPRPPVRPPRPPARGGGATVVTGAPVGATPGATAQSDSPFGAYVPPPGGASPLQTPPSPPKRPPMPGKLNLADKQPRGGSGGLIALVVVLILAIGGGGFAFTQNWFGLLGPAPTPQPPDVIVADTEDPQPPETEPGSDPNGKSTLIPDDADDQPIETDVADIPPVTTEPEPELQPEPEPQPEPELTDVNEPVGIVPPVDRVAAMLDWVKAYRLQSCEFARALTADNRSMDIEAYGLTTAPFVTLMTEFQAEHGIEPDIGVRIATQPQCPAVDFLRFVEPLAETGPKLNVEEAQVPRGGRLAGTLTGTSGWRTDLLVVDDAGVVHTVATIPSASGSGATFSTPLTSSAREAAPMIVLSISSVGGLSIPGSADGKSASTVFPAILREMQQSSTNVAVGVKYVKLAAR